MLTEQKIHVVHVIYRLDMGGMESGLINLINRLPPSRFSHTIVCLTHATDFKDRIRQNNVRIIEMNKAEGKTPGIYRRIYLELKRLDADILHTRNLGTLDLNWSGLAARIPVRIHGEHGWDVADPQGQSLKYKLVRKVCDSAIYRYVAVSKDIRRWLRDVIGIPSEKIVQIYNGVDTEKFAAKGMVATIPFSKPMKIVFGTVGRQDAIKGLGVLLDAIKLVFEERPEYREYVGVVLAGIGPESERCREKISCLDIEENVFMAGQVEDVPALLRKLDFYVQTSLNEGISNTILEAKATGLAVICTDVGGNPEIVRHGEDGYLIRRNDCENLADNIRRYIDDGPLRNQHGLAGRIDVTKRFSLTAMTNAYAELYSLTSASRRIPRVT